jgi:hypothetical protein
MTVSEFFTGAPPNYNSLRYGIEIELENASMSAFSPHASPPMPGSWMVTTDGSLRGQNVELISAPTGFKGILSQLRQVYRVIEVRRPVANTRTGTHVHVNVGHMPMRRFRALLALYCCVEPLLFHQVGMQRSYGPYCVPLYAIRAQWAAMGWVSGRELLRGWCKYAALNLRPIASLQTIEFRHAPAWTELESMVRWFKTIHHLVKCSDGFSDEQEVVAAATDDLGKFLKRVCYTYNADELPLYDQLTSEHDSIGTAILFTEQAGATPVSEVEEVSGWSIRDEPLLVQDFLRYRGQSPRPRQLSRVNRNIINRAANRFEQALRIDRETVQGSTF